MMLEVLYRIYEVADEETKAKNLQSEIDFGFCSTSQAQNIELLMDCLICDSRERFKEIIRSEYGNGIAFRYSRKLKPGDVYCIIIGEHCYDTEKYFNKMKFKCDFCGTEVETYYKNPIGFSPYEIRSDLYGIEEYSKKRFCSNKCKFAFLERERRTLKPADDTEFYVTRDMFTEDISGYIYKITKKSTGEFYVGQTQYAPVFRWGQHLKTERFPIAGILDYKFEVLEIVPKGENILEREKNYIQLLYRENPEKSLNIACVAGAYDNDPNQMELEKVKEFLKESKANTE